MEEKNNIPITKTEEKPAIKITEWKHAQSIGKFIPIDEFLKDKSNDLSRITNFKISNDGLFYVVSDMGGRIIIYKNNQDDGSAPKLEYFFQYQAQEKEFDVHKSCELSQSVRSLDIVYSDHDKIDVLSSNYRNIKYDRIQMKSKVYEYDTDNDSTLSENDQNYIPKINSFKYEKKHKTKRQYKLAHTYEINSVISNNFNKYNFISSDDYKIMLWDVNKDSEVYNIVNIEDNDNEAETTEKITVTKYNNNDPHFLAFGTSFGNIFLSDLRVSSNILSNSLKFRDEASPFINTVFSNQMTKVHDLDFFNEKNDNTLVTRHYLSLNLWDKRNLKIPVIRIMLYEPLISKLSYLYGNNFMNDKFSLSLDKNGKNIITGGYNNMFHVVDLEQKLNTQIIIDQNNTKVMNTNTIRRINGKGCCFYKKDDPSYTNIDFNKKILYQKFSPIENEKFITFTALNCIYSYIGKLNEKK